LVNVKHKFLVDNHTFLTYRLFMQTVVETEFYLRDAKTAGLSDDER